MKTIHAYSYDMDGCVLLGSDGDEIQPIMDRNAALFQQAKDIHGVKYVFCGSGRQTPYKDAQAAYLNKGPLASAILPVIAEHIGAIYNTFLFGDIVSVIEDNYSPIHNRYAPGTLHQHNMEGKLNLEIESSAYMDCNKVAMIYAQISNLCIHEPDADEIVFNFYDDREDILDAISQFFHTFPAFISHKVKLKLWHYSDFDGVKEPVLHHELRGESLKTHENYYQVIEKLIQMETLNLGGLDLSRVLIVRSILELGTNGTKSHEPNVGLIDKRIKTINQTSHSNNPNSATQARVNYGWQTNISPQTNLNDDTNPTRLRLTNKGASTSK